MDTGSGNECVHSSKKRIRGKFDRTGMIYSNKPPFKFYFATIKIDDMETDNVIRGGLDKYIGLEDRPSQILAEQ